MAESSISVSIGGTCCAEDGGENVLCITSCMATSTDSLWGTESMCVDQSKY